MKGSKKPLILISVALCLIIVLGITGVVVARYISTTGVKSNTVSISKWGFKLCADASELFGKSNTSRSDGDANGSISAGGEAGDAIIAPGDSGKMTFSIEGSAEVSSRIDFKVEYEDIRIGARIDPTYRPLKWVLKKDGEILKDADGLALSDMAKYIEGLSQTVASGENADACGEYTLEWKWEKNSQNDENDTILGRVASGDDKTTLACTDIFLNITISVTQIKE